MEAILKVNYGLTNKGLKFQVIEVNKNIVTLLINNNKVDFSHKEVELIPSFSLGRYFLHKLSNNDNLNLRNSDIEKSIKLNNLTNYKTVIFKSLDIFIYGN